MKLSIVIPVYNVENTLVRCLDSVLAQSYHEYELILVDDGSTDGSAEICKYYDHRNVFIHYIRQSNKGLSGARNTGIEVAQGEYITFIDSDDYIAPDTLATLMKEIEDHQEYDILEYPMYVHYGCSRAHKLAFPPLCYSSFDEYWLKGKAYMHAYACNKIYKTVLFQHIRYPIGKKFEDVYVLPKLCKVARNIATTNKGLYYYCWNKDGITANASGEDLAQLLNVNIKLLSDYHDEDYYLHILNIQMDVYELTGLQPSIPTYHYYHYVKLTLLNIIGINNLCKFNKILHKIYRRRL